MSDLEINKLKGKFWLKAEYISVRRDMCKLLNRDFLRVVVYVISNASVQIVPIVINRFISA